MKNFFLIIATAISFSLNAQIFYVDTNNSGFHASAMGDNTTASGDYFTAMGYYTTASEYVSTAMGFQTTASGYYSTAMGEGTTASGIGSTAMGLWTVASDRSSSVLGQWNLAGSTVTNSATQFSTDNTAFVIGNGSDGNNRSDALVVKFNGDATLAGSMTATSFIGDGSQLTNLPSSGADLPFSYNSNEAGGIEVANYTIASGSNAFAVGNDNSASGTESTAMGRGTTASGTQSTAMGFQTTASGIGSTAMGGLTEASEEYSTAMGYTSTASGGFSTAMGNDTTASEWYATAMGVGTTASGIGSTAMGVETTASGKYSTAMGGLTTADDYMTFAVGVHNKTDETPNPDNFSYQNTAFVIGNGGYDNDGSYIGTPESYSNAFEVLFDGTTTIAGDLNVNSDARLKANIISLGSTLSKLLQIDGKSYTIKKDESEKQKIGLLAQDIEKVFPELVSESNGVKSVNYQGLVPVLINALKEQDSKMNEQEARIERLEKLLLNS